LARYVLRDATYPLVGLLCIAAFVGLTPSYYRFHYLIDTQYGLWLSLGLAGLLLLEANAQGRVSLPRRIGAVVLLILAHWCYCTASLFLGPLVVSRWLLFRRVPARMRTRMLFGELAASLTSLALAFVVGLLLMRLSPVTNTDFGTLPVDEWPRTLYRLLATTWQHLAPQWWPLTLAAGLLVALLGTRSSGYDSALASAWRSAAVFVGAAALLTLFLATRRWVPENSYRIRFLFIPAIYAQAACVSLTVATCAARCGGFVHRVVLPMGGALVFLTVAVCLGRPGLSEVRGALARRQATVDARGRPVHIRPEDVLATACTHIAGNYWLVWPAMFHANLALCDRGEDRVVWGLSKSSEPTSDFWRAIPRAQTRIAVFAQGDEEANQFLSSFGFLPLLACEKRDSVIVLEPAESAVRTSGLTR
jgi:hypothetical protein